MTCLTGVRRDLGVSLRLAVLAAITLLPLHLQAATAESIGDARIDRDSESGLWTLKAGGASMSLRIDPDQDYAVTSLVSPAGRNWITAGGGSDTIVTVDGAARVFGSRSSGFAYNSVTTHSDGRHLQLDAAFILQPQNLRVTRHVAVVSGSPTFEVWTSFEALEDSVAVSNLDAFRIVVAPGTLHWLTGQQSAPGDATLDTAFARREQTLDIGESLSVDSVNRSSEIMVPWLGVDGDNDELYAGLLWSGGWSLKATRSTAGLSIGWGLASMSTAVGNTAVEGPHAIIGVARGSLPEASAALRSYIIEGIRQGRPLTPLVTYNTWFAYGTRVDESSMRREMARVAEMGVEVFVIDAGWYAGADVRDTRDFETGLGIWAADTERFPSGLRALRDYAHSLGMKFGLWVEPERASLSVAGQDGLDESAFATIHGSYEADDSALICLSGKAGRQWVLDHLTRLIDSVQPDYLKWDNNLWLNCDRAGHGHGPNDGNFAHVTGLYELLDTLRQLYPALTIENCASGGNRLDFGMLRYSDVAWMDDHTQPSVKVRHNFDGLSMIFPPAYLLSFLTNLGWEPLHNSPDLLMYVRSRMQGILGLCFQSAWLSDEDRDDIAAQVTLYKALRPIQAAASAALLTGQPSGADPGSEWDVVQETASDGSVILYAFESSRSTSSTVVLPSALKPDLRYRVTSVDSGLLGEVTGNDLMANGIKLVRSPLTAAHVLSLVPEP